MDSYLPIVVIIATSCGRTDRLLQQAIPSVLSQSYLPMACVVVNDNEDSREHNKIEIGLQIMQQETSVELVLIPNDRARGFSGTGAWNSGFAYAREYSCIRLGKDDVYIAILDDDDKWAPDHLELCVQNIQNTTKAVFCNLTRIYSSYEEPGKLKSSRDLIISQFLYGNPGVQGSNMCFRLSAIEAIGGFDETLRSCTDRDLMIRFLEKFGNQDISVVSKQTVWHDARSQDCVTNNKETKTAGLDTFYQKHLWRFEEEILLESLSRAKRLFSYPHSNQIWQNFYQSKEIIAVMMPLHNGAGSIRQSVLSVVQQKPTFHPIVLFIGDDSSSDNWRGEIEDLMEKYHNIVVTSIDGGTPSKARNALVEYVLKNYPNTYFLCRLDSDDRLNATDTLVEVERLFIEHNIQALLCGNYQVQYGEIVGENRAIQAFHDKNYMRNRLFRMSKGDFSAELPSCNLCFRPKVQISYPIEDSGEDHWLLIRMLLSLPSKDFLIEENLMYCMYSLGGDSTKSNKNNNTYIDSRQRLYEYYIIQTNS